MLIETDRSALSDDTRDEGTRLLTQLVLSDLATHHIHQPALGTMDYSKKKGSTKDSPQMQQTKGSWKQFKGHVQETWGDLTGDEMDQFKGKRDRLEGYIQKQTGEKREAIHKKLDGLAKKTDYSF